MRNLNILLSFFLYLSILNVVLITRATGRVCEFKNQTFQECDVMFYINWTICDGRNCPYGQQTRDKGICCFKDNIRPGYTLIDWCGLKCNLTDDDFKETVPRNLTTEIGYEESEINNKSNQKLNNVSSLVTINRIINSNS